MFKSQSHHRYPILLILLCHVGTFLSGQWQELDTLSSDLKPYYDSIIHYRSRDIPKAKGLALDLYNEAEKKSSEHWLAWYYYHIANIQIEENELDSAIFYFDTAYATLQKLEFTDYYFLADWNTNYAYVLDRQGLIEESFFHQWQNVEYRKR